MRRGSSGVRAWNGAGSGPKNAETYLGRLSQDLPIGPKPVPFGITLKTSKYEPPKGTTLGPMGMDRPILSTSLSICLSAYLSRSMSCCSFKERGIQILRTGTVLAIRACLGGRPKQCQTMHHVHPHRKDHQRTTTTTREERRSGPPAPPPPRRPL